MFNLINGLNDRKEKNGLNWLKEKNGLNDGLDMQHHARIGDAALETDLTGIWLATEQLPAQLARAIAP